MTSSEAAPQTVEKSCVGSASLGQRRFAPLRGAVTEMSHLGHGGATFLSFNQGMKKRLLLALIVISVVTVSLAAYYRSNTTDSAPQFTTAAVTRGDVVQTVEATGTLEPVTTVQVGTQ